MLLPSPLLPGKLVRRYQRFLADVLLENGAMVTAHCPNSGSMKGCGNPGSEVLLSVANDPKRRCPYTWQLVRVGRTWVGINTLFANRLVAEGIHLGLVPELAGYGLLRREVHFGAHTRFDLSLTNGDAPCFVEVKNVTLVEKGVAYFPDAVTRRGTRHLVELMRARAEGYRAVVFFVVQKSDARLVRPAVHIDPVYAATLRLAVAHGVECFAYVAAVSRRSIQLAGRIPCELALAVGEKAPSPLGGGDRSQRTTHTDGRLR